MDFQENSKTRENKENIISDFVLLCPTAFLGVDI